MKGILKEERFNFISHDDKTFILAFDNEITKLGYDFGGKIGSGFVWGKYMIIYTKTGVKSKKVVARIYIRDEGIVLRLFFSKTDAHRDYIENAPVYIKEVFVGDHGNCDRCHNDKDGVCKFRRKYTLEHRLIEKCNGRTFEFHNPSLDRIVGYMDLFAEFYSKKKRI